MRKFLSLIIAVAVAAVVFIAYKGLTSSQKESVESAEVQPKQYVVEMELQSQAYPTVARAAVEKKCRGVSSSYGADGVREYHI